MAGLKRRSRQELADELEIIESASKQQLQGRYLSLFGSDPPRAFGPDLLRRAVAQRLQEGTHGGLSRSVQRELNRLIRLMVGKPGTRLNLARHAKAGTVLVRDWKGTAHRVEMLERGFLYRSKKYSNLSEIARLITGTRWNGPRFFGLRRQPADPRERGLAKTALANSRSKSQPVGATTKRRQRVAVMNGL